jgi:phage-related protein/predicted XRE-type DNA-binding protein
MPDEVQQTFGFALYHAQVGLLHAAAKPLKGFGSAGVLEVAEDWRGDAYRAVYTVRFAEAVYVLHCFQKKSKHGSETPRKYMDLIRERLKEAEALAKRSQAMKNAEGMNVYKDLGFPDSEEMLVKAQLVVKIAHILRERGWSQQQAATVLGMTQPKLSKMLRGQFRGISEMKMMDCLVRLGCAVKIVVGPGSQAIEDRIEVVAA